MAENLERPFRHGGIFQKYDIDIYITSILYSMDVQYWNQICVCMQFILALKNVHMLEKKYWSMSQNKILKQVQSCSQEVLKYDGKLFYLEIIF